MAHINSFTLLGRTYPLKTSRAMKAYGVALLTLLLAYAYMVFLVVTVVDYYLGTTRVGAAIILIVLYVEATFNTPTGPKVVTLLPRWGRVLLPVVLVVVTLVTFLSQGELFRFSYVAIVAGGLAAQRITAKIHENREQQEQLRRSLAAGLGAFGYGKRDSSPKDKRST